MAKPDLLNVDLEACDITKGEGFERLRNRELTRGVPDSILVYFHHKGFAFVEKMRHDPLIESWQARSTAMLQQ